MDLSLETAMKQIQIIQDPPDLLPKHDIIFLGVRSFLFITHFLITVFGSISKFRVLFYIITAQS